MNNELYDHLQVIEIMMNSGEIMTALMKLEDLSHSHPDQHQIFSLLGECYLCLGKPDKAIKALKWSTIRQQNSQLHKKHPSSPVSNQNTNESNTVKNLNRVFNNKNSNHLWVDHYLLGCAYGRCSKYKQSIQHLNIADKMNPNNAEILRNLGWIRCLQKKTVSGRSLLKKAIKLDPQNALAYNDLGASYIFEKNFKKANKLINKAITLDPNDPFIQETANKLEDLQAYETIFGNSSQAKTQS